MTTSPAAIVRADDHIFPEENTEGLAVLPSRLLINGSKFALDNPSLIMDLQETHSFVIFLDLSEEAKIIYASDSCYDLLGYKPDELIGKSYKELVHPTERTAFSNLEYQHVENDIAASLTFHRANVPDSPLVAFSRSVAYNFIVGALSPATDDAGNARAATATGGVFVLTPDAIDRAFRRWNNRDDPGAREIYTGSDVVRSVPIDQLPQPSKRVAILLDRFKQRVAHVLHCSNDCIVPAELVFNQDLFQFIPVEEDKAALNSAVNVVKTWGTQFDGGADGIFAFCRFTLETPTDPPERKDLDGIVSATSDAILLTLVLRT